MNKNFMIIVGLIAVTLAAAIYFTEYLIFGDVTRVNETFFDNLAFLPISAFIVVVIIERLLTRQEKQAMFQKLNMVVGVFFSEVGNNLLKNLTNHIDDKHEIYQQFKINGQWKDSDYNKAVIFAAKMKGFGKSSGEELENLKAFLVQKRPFLLRLLENPNLLEHERFTDLLWAVFHLTEELEARSDLRNLPETDYQHINGDLQRIYNLITEQWLNYARHLQKSYPFLFSLVVRTHPFQENPSPDVK
jgi:hypothetical protein